MLPGQEVTVDAKDTSEDMLSVTMGKTGRTGGKVDGGFVGRKDIRLPLTTWHDCHVVRTNVALRVDAKTMSSISLVLDTESQR